VSADSIVIVGVGHAAVQLCASLVEAGQGHRVHLLGHEPELPYQRPPLSKSFLKKADEPTQLLREASWFEQAGVKLSLGQTVQAIDRQAKTLILGSGATLGYGQLVLATGTRARTLPGWPAHASNVRLLRSAQDARALRAAIGACQAVTVVGGGFIGLEVAATCAALGKAVTVLEAGRRLMGRAVSPALSAHVLAQHRAAGIGIELATELGEPVFHEGRLMRLQAPTGAREVDLLLVAIGALPNAELAQASGLACDNGVRVDAGMRTSDPDIWAVGDCAQFPLGSQRWRLESIQNAQDQARVAASRLLGGAAIYRPVPWFWSEQGAMRLQMVGLTDAGPLQTVRREGPQPGALSLFHYQQGVLRCVESVNAPADYMVARKWLESGASPDPKRVADAGQPLRSLLPLA
jgi:3-phenylpropionate/trans-cinnamate dioxygenase ferredoxin reductase component